MSSNKPTDCDNRPNFIQIDCKISEKMETEVADFLYNCDL